MNECERVGNKKGFLKKGRSVSLDGIPDLHCNNGRKSFVGCLSVGGKGLLCCIKRREKKA